MKNSKNQNQDSRNQDSINLSNIQIDLAKRDKNIPLDKETVKSNKSLYKGMEGMKGEDQKKFRSKIRRALQSFCNQVLGKDRSEEERVASIKSFLKFYQENWKIQDFKIENFSQSKDLDDLKDYKNLLALVQSSLSGNARMKDKKGKKIAEKKEETPAA